MSGRPNGFQSGFSSDVPFAAGSVRGVRYWNVTYLATHTVTASLRGQRGHDWTAGENVAECLVYEGSCGCLMCSVAKANGEPVPHDDTTKCDGVEPDCTCGFYAYWGEDPQGIGNVAGVIEGYGLTVIGPYGFRCQKAKILAVAPKNTGGGYYLTTPLGSKVTVGARVTAYTSDWWGHYKDNIQAAYPDVAVFDTYEAMVAEFPADDRPEGVPERERVSQLGAMLSQVTYPTAYGHPFAAAAARAQAQVGAMVKQLALSTVDLGAAKRPSWWRRAARWVFGGPLWRALAVSWLPWWPPFVTLGPLGAGAWRLALLAPVVLITGAYWADAFTRDKP